ncbi:hypothetical protein COX68_02115 [Candidatus Falkowbacteria bacterium CG_4_10_14_0_2_um_filter_41_15]|uniref:Uncharacterized protein n=1 Tax=Candidatus Falkowbacteria bacterium CG_4_10_14_0_2_um_filter_41_15 TaxID=1974554 RepID=A0A2M7VYQ2_9BACT|nr:MAG: hypothetical protein COX68_02115 [Candidatus Falkowbacteria bacterium CG_4_10_14_0_2_um_filter_41_15]
MAKPTRYAPLYCTILTIVTVIMALAAFYSHNPLWIVVGLLPAVIYEVYRTEEGAITKYSSILLLLILVLEIILVVFKINFDLAAFFGEESKYVGGYYLPLSDIKIFGPILTAILSVILFFRTAGIYTKWLSVVICLGSLTAVYIINPVFFQSILKVVTNGLLDRINLY